jgi:hypothetical protein
LRRYLSLPAVSTLVRHFQPRILELEANLVNLEWIPAILERHPDLAYVTIAIDAVSLDNVFLTDQPEPSTMSDPSQAFVYECLPLSTTAWCFPLHIMASMSGHATGAHAEVAALISRNLAQMPKPVEVVFITTDGDLDYTV